MDPVSAPPTNCWTRQTPARVALLVASLALPAAHRAPAKGELVLDAASPIVAVTIDGIPLRLRVDLAAQDAVELNPGAAARLPVRWQGDLPLDVGRVRLPGRAALASLVMEGETVPVQVADHGRDCCKEADGAIAPGLLPFATVRWQRAQAPEPTATRTLALEWAPETGYAAPVPDENATVRVRFDPFAPETSATAAAGALLARAWGGHWAGPPTRITAAFGVERPARPISFDHAGTLASFPLPRLLVRLADFGGSERLPVEPSEPGDIVVRRRMGRQHAWPVVTLSADRLNRCREIRFDTQPLSLTLSCAFTS